MYRALLSAEPPLRPDELRRDLEDVGFDIIAENLDPGVLPQDVVRNAPDFVVAATVSASTQLIEAARVAATLAPCPFIMFTSDGDAEKIQLASASGVHAYVVDGYAKHRLLSIIQVAQARFRHEQLMRDELSDLNKRFEERKQVDRAKGLLMRSRGVTEDEAFELLRSLAMRTRQRLGLVATSVINMSRAGEAVNRAGQLRMLSQRVAKCYAQTLAGIDAEDGMLSLADCVARVEANLGILRKAVSLKGYGELVERVAATWGEVMQICVVAPQPGMLKTLDAHCDAMLREAERLTDFIESSGLVASLHVLNVAGRQRMLSQRIAKLCFLLAVSPDAAQLVQLREQTSAFQKALEYLQDAPLSSKSIGSQLQAALSEWSRLRTKLDSLADADALQFISESSERLLHIVERLTEEYEQAMVVLIGDRIRHLA